MAANHPEAYWEGVAQIIQGESKKASVYVTHAGSLGVAREAIFRRVLIDETPHKFKVQTGLIRHRQPEPIVVSSQCDLLVHEPGDEPPLYHIDEFVVVPNTRARFVIEVKSKLNNETFDDVLKVYDSLITFPQRSLPIPVFGYAFEGVTFSTFVEYIANAAKANRLKRGDEQKHLNWPNCIACSHPNYVGIRATENQATGRYYFLAIDAGNAAGMGTALFMQFYYSLLNGQPISTINLHNWFNALSVPSIVADKRWIEPDGTVHSGNIPRDRT